VLPSCNRYVSDSHKSVDDVVFVYAECVGKSLGSRYVGDDGGKEVDPALEEHVEQTIVANEHVEMDSGQAGHSDQR
jgi:hypothetical protein